VTLETKASDPASVDAYLKALKHPMKPVVEALRAVILSAHKGVGEEIKWNAPAFFYTGTLAPFDPKTYKRHMVVMNLFKKNELRLVFWGGARAQDTTGFLTGDYKDGRRLASFSSLDDVKAHTKVLQGVIKKQIATIDD
jgi:hypothetical protein